MVKKLLCECDKCKKEFLIKYHGHVPTVETHCKKCVIEILKRENNG